MFRWIPVITGERDKMNNFFRGFAVLALLFVSALSGCACEVVNPGYRGVLVDFGKVSPELRSEGLQFYCPLTGGMGCQLEQINVRQQKEDVVASCFSSDLQEVNLKVTVLYKIPETEVISIFRDFHGEPFTTLVAPRVQESIKEATSTRSAEMIVKQREAIKNIALESVRAKVGSKVQIIDLVISDIGLSKGLTASIEKKMIQEQTAETAKYTKQQATTDAERAVEVAKGQAEATLTNARAEAESIRIRGDALRQNPGVIQLQLIERWDGHSPQIVSGSSSGISLLMPALASPVAVPVKAVAEK
jgi:prohibitin 2